MPSQKKPASIAAYIKAAPEAAQDKLWQMHECIRAAAPNASEGLKWSKPAYAYNRILVMFAVFKNHIGFYPTPSAIKAFAKSLSKYKTAEGSVQFPLEQPLPLDLIARITKFRAQESLAGNVKWKG